MSTDSRSPSSSIHLSLAARPGIAIRILDGGLQEVGRGLERMDVGLAPGLYQVEWSSAGQQSQTIVRLDGREDKVEVRFDPSDRSALEAAGSAPGDHIALVDAVNGAIKPSERSYGSSIVLVVTGSPELLRALGPLNLRLYDRNEVAMRARADGAPNLDLSDGDIAHCYKVRPGRYHLGFQSILGERLGQSVPALAGRQTLVFLTVARTTLIVANGDEFANVGSVGVDPARTCIVTVRGDEDDYRVRERVRLANLMLFDLGSGSNSLSADVAAVLDDPNTDPLLRLYGALVMLAAWERDSKSGGGDSPGLAFSSAWVGRLGDWISDPSQRGLPTDATAAAWELKRRAPRLAGSPGGFKPPSRIEAPPMLECAWRWAIEESIARPTAVRGAAIVATARSSGGTIPWLCWQLSAAKAKFEPVPTSTDDLSTLVRQVAEKVGSMVEPDKLGRALSTGFETLSPELQVTALRALQLAVPDATRVSPDTISDLAVALGLPSRLLRKRLVHTSAALDAAAEAPSPAATRPGGRKVAPLREQAPGLSRAVEFKNDLQKGRFGRKASRGGFTASAEFEPTRSKNWVRIVLSVEGPGRDGEKVQFHLHDSFRPPLETRKFKNGHAKLKVTVWGGFTLGVWIPAHGVELELDLTALKDAPRIVRLR